MKREVRGFMDYGLWGVGWGVGVRRAEVDRGREGRREGGWTASCWEMLVEVEVLERGGEELG
jgi:hypothetical protein